MDLTPEEIKNGWTEESLKRYLLERESAASLKVFPDKPDLVIHGQKDFNPKKF